MKGPTGIHMRGQWHVQVAGERAGSDRNVVWDRDQGEGGELTDPMM
jgi:hypothetical protein